MYRGYDSWGIAFRENEKVITQKFVGKISDNKKEFSASSETIGHSRWATHGSVTEENSHPHSVGKITLVHNGIFENFQDHKNSFKNYKFISETDSEVIALMLDEEFKKINNLDHENIIQIIKNICQQITGRFAIVFMVENFPGIFAVRRGSPLIIGKNENETYIASDIPAFLAKTNIVNYLDDNEIVWIDKTNIKFNSLEDLSPVQKRDIEVPWKSESAQKGDYLHFMIKEIFEQKETIAKVLRHSNQELLSALEIMKKCNGVYFIGCGTAHKVAMMAEYFFAEISQRKINVVAASEFEHFKHFINEKTLIIAISQSGETADVLEALEIGKSQGANILSLTNVEGSSIARLADVNLSIFAGPEKAVASTKASSSQIALCFLLAYADAELYGKNNLNLGREILGNAISDVNDMLNPRYENLIKLIAQKYYQESLIFVIGRGSFYPLALEAAIKIQEVSYINAQGFPAGELKHGPIAMIEKGVPCLILDDDLQTLSNAIELKSRGAKIIGFSQENHPEVFDDWIRIPNNEQIQVLNSLIPIQIFAYHLAILKGLNPDMPRNLAKSVTVK